MFPIDPWLAPQSRQDQLARACDQQKAPAQRVLAGPSLRSLNANAQKAGILGCLRPATKVEVMASLRGQTRNLPTYSGSSIISRILLASASIVKGLMTISIPGSRNA